MDGPAGSGPTGSFSGAPLYLQFLFERWGSQSAPGLRDGQFRVGVEPTPSEPDPPGGWVRLDDFDIVPGPDVLLRESGDRPSVIDKTTSGASRWGRAAPLIPGVRDGHRQPVGQRTTPFADCGGRTGRRCSPNESLEQSTRLGLRCADLSPRTGLRLDADPMRSGHAGASHSPAESSPAAPSRAPWPSNRGGGHLEADGLLPGLGASTLASPSPLGPGGRGLGVDDWTGLSPRRLGPLGGERFGAECGGGSSTSLRALSWLSVRDGGRREPEPPASSGPAGGRRALLAHRIPGCAPLGGGLPEGIRPGAPSLRGIPGYGSRNWGATTASWGPSRFRDDAPGLARGVELLSPKQKLLEGMTSWVLYPVVAVEFAGADGLLRPFPPGTGARPGPSPPGYRLWATPGELGTWSGSSPGWPPPPWIWRPSAEAHALTGRGGLRLGPPGLGCGPPPTGWIVRAERADLLRPVECGGLPGPPERDQRANLLWVRLHGGSLRSRTGCAPSTAQGCSHLRIQPSSF